jgi:hypothetical protein
MELIAPGFSTCGVRAVGGPGARATQFPYVPADSSGGGTPSTATTTLAAHQPPQPPTSGIYARAESSAIPAAAKHGNCSPRNPVSTCCTRGQAARKGAPPAPQPASRRCRTPSTVQLSPPPGALHAGHIAPTVGTYYRSWWRRRFACRMPVRGTSSVSESPSTCLPGTASCTEGTQQDVCTASCCDLWRHPADY